MTTMNQNNTQSILFVVLGETTHELEMARAILNDTEICATIYLEKGEDTLEQSFVTALDEYPDCRMVVITVSGDGIILQDAMVLAKLAKERGLLTVVETPCCSRTPAEYLADQSLSIEELLARTDCVLWATGEEFYHDVRCFQQYLTSVLDGNDFIYLDFDDVGTILKDSGFAYLGAASIKGVDTAARKACMAAEKIMPTEILKRANGVIMHITGSNDIGLEDVETVAEMIQPHTNPDVVLLFGAGFDSYLNQEIQISVLAAGISN